ncbi:hypothetical protein PFICI_11598 [Pestalotiopsis fici W106-1]|uniref:Uncharacterized protein n=1 Tax=Pestalotiopsis fici (strain W106-1 / CGMCC3.15140) TaxID=1229662 RepID=W3WTP6_PESFW|nr:uncharacterized protein PFICI_11598 [Pestalotiopsis fici W106-1]ETS76211.1 hypothetical protein PFICI_11598 [Pestalotiopsis fici W106-1]
MAEAIADFFAEAIRLYEHVLSLDSEAKHDEENTSHESFFCAFDILASRLAEHSELTAVEPDNPDGMEKMLIKACWKMSHDILLRLGRKKTEQQDLNDYIIPVSYALNWTAQDVEALGTRLLQLNTQWRCLHPSDDKTAQFVQKLSSLRPIHEVALQIKDPAMNTEISQALSTPASILSDFILETLSFKSMKNREEEVAEAHRNTFDWIFKYSFGDVSEGGFGDQFSRWLQSSELGNTYWITGKPGSGKSTIMRYISEHKTTAQLLRSWAGEDKLTKASFYFWTSGSEEQRSQTGLLRYLLHQLLSSSAHLMPKVFPELWQKLSTMSTRERIRFSVEWNAIELMDGFHRFLAHALDSTKICLFVDGLDEFDGDHQEIIRFFKAIAEDGERKGVKLCLSSRPWPVFEEAFAYAVPNLKLQELTFNDMATYVEDNLSQDPKMKQIVCQKAIGGNSLVHDVVHRAEGVFLWVRLVVRKILEIHGHDPDLSRIRPFLQTLPSDLDNLFDKLLFQDQTPAQITETSHMFQLVHAREVVANFIKDESANSLTIWELAFALDAAIVGDDEDFEEATNDEIHARCNATVERINVSSTGLLETYLDQTRDDRFVPILSQRSDHTRAQGRDLAESRVTYLHRTVRDYLIAKQGVWSKILGHCAADFDPHERLIQSYCQRLRHSIEPIEHHRRLDDWYPDIALSLSHARYMTYTPRRQNTQIALVNQVEHGISWYWLRRPGDEYDHWARGCFGTYEQRKGNKLIIQHPYLALCTKFGLEQYVLATLDHLAEDEGHVDSAETDSSTLHIKEETPLLSYALEFLTSRQKTIMPLSSPAFIKSLLESRHLSHPVLGRLIGTANMEFDSPIKKKQGTTPWLLTLSQLRDAKRRGWIEPFDVSTDGTFRWTKIVKLLIQEGQADRNAFLKWNGFDEECYAKDVLSGPEQLGGIDDYWIQQLGKVMIE